jgi:hypothetical protein
MMNKDGLRRDSLRESLKTKGRAGESKLGPGQRRIRFDTLLKRSSRAKIVVHDNPYFLNQRLTAHQGAFLFAGDIRRPFCENLKSM